MKKISLLFIVIVMISRSAGAQCITVPATPPDAEVATTNTATGWAFGFVVPRGVETGDISTGGNFGGISFNETNGRFSWQPLGGSNDLVTTFGTSLLANVNTGNTNAFPGPPAPGPDTFMVFNYSGSFMTSGKNMRNTTVNIVDPALNPDPTNPGHMNLSYTLYGAGELSNPAAAGLYYVANFGNITVNTTKPIFLKNMDMQIVGSSAWTNGIVYPNGMNNGIPTKVRFGGNESNGLPTPVASSPTGTSATAYVNGLVSLDSFSVAVTNFILPTGDGCGTKYAPMTVSTAANTVINAEYNYMPPPPLGIVAPLIISPTLHLVANAISPVASYQVDGSSVPNLSGNETTIATNASNKTTSTNATISVPYDANLWGNTIVPAAAPDELVLMGWDGTVWTILPTTGGQTGLSSGTLTTTGLNLTLYSKISVGRVTRLNPLPIVLSYFTATRSNKDAILKWETKTEHNTKYFDILESTDGVNFTSLGSITAAGFSTAAIVYDFTHKNVSFGTHYYRIKQVDIDNRYVYTDIRALSFNEQNIITLSPNPAIDILYIRGLGGDNLINITDASGRKVYEKATTAPVLQVDVKKFAKGTYFVTITDTKINKNIRSIAFIKP